MKILFLSRWFPYPPNNGSKIRIYNLLQGLALQNELTLITFAETSEFPVDRRMLSTLCREIHVIPRKPFDPSSRKSRLGLLSFAPRSVIDTYSTAMQRCIEDTLAQAAYDLVIASQFDMAVYHKLFKHLPALFEEVEIGVFNDQYQNAPTLSQRLRKGLTWAKHKHYLATLLDNFTASTVASEQERKLLCQVVKPTTPIEVIPNCVDLKSYPSSNQVSEENTLIFTGAFSYEPNYEAMVWFLAEVYPLVQAKVPNVRLIITGKHGERSLPPAKNVTLTGFVDDVHSLIAEAQVSLVPLHTGGGNALKDFGSDGPLYPGGGHLQRG